MFFIQEGHWLLALVLFVLANIGANGSFVFYDALLPHVAREHEMDRVSTAGYALGYIGGGLLLAFCLLMTQKPAWFGLPHGQGLSAGDASLPARISFVLTALWWLLFSIPLFRRVGEPAPPAHAAGSTRISAIGDSLAQLRRTLRELAVYRQALVMLIAFLLYNDGIGTIIRMAAIYGEEMGLSRGVMIGAIVMVQFVGIPFAFLFGSLAGRIGARRAIFLGLAAYAGISVLGYFMRTATHFLVLAGLVGVVQGGTQALSRSLFASLIPRQKSGEFFGFFSVFEKFAGIFGPLVFAGTIAATGSSRNAILSVIAFFAVGAAILAAVDVDRGAAEAHAAEAAQLGPLVAETADA
jgi:UMF1 family MFS transporter